LARNGLATVGSVQAAAFSVAWKLRSRAGGTMRPDDVMLASAQLVPGVVNGEGVSGECSPSPWPGKPVGRQRLVPLDPDLLDQGPEDRLL